MMDWTTSYILVRPRSENSLEVVHTAEKLKDARYWLRYIAQPEDAIFTTPLHNQYRGDGTPKYMSHLVQRGKMDFNEAQWKLSFSNQAIDKFDFIVKIPKKETKIIDLSDSAQPLTLDELKHLVSVNAKQLEVLLSDPTKWLQWESSVAVAGKDVYIIAVNPESEWPLTVTVRTNNGSDVNVNYDAKMQFVVKPRAST